MKETPSNLKGEIETNIERPCQGGATRRGLKPHPKYKDSGIPWIGEIPEGWEVWKISHAYSLIGS